MPTFTFAFRRGSLRTSGLPVPPLPDGEEEATADTKDLTFRFELFPSGREQLQIQQRLDYLNGGIGVTVDLDLAIEQTTAECRQHAMRVVWPHGRKVDDQGNDEAMTAEESRAMAAAMETAPAARRLRRLIDMDTTQHAIAEWSVLARELPTPEWRDFEELRMPPALRDAILFAYAAAKMEAADLLGKGQPSAS